MQSITLYDYSKSCTPVNLPPEKIDRLEEYAQSIWNNRVTTLNEENSSNTNQQIIQFDRNNYITTNKYVGVIKYDDVKIEIRPRILNGNGTNWGLNLLFWMSYGTRFNIPFHKLDIKNYDSEDILEILAMLFSKYANSIISSQPYFAYTQEDCESSYLRGRLLFEKQISNLANGRWHKFHISHNPFLYDNLLNRIIKFVVKRLASVCNLAKDNLNQLLFILDEVSDINNCTLSDCDRVNINPLYEDYYILMDMCRMFIENLTTSYDTGDDNNYSFILPMNLVFEDFILGFINKHYPELRAEGQKNGWLASRNGQNVFKTKNDIFLHSHKVIIDTKYKIRRDNENNKGGVDQNDVYQMIGYAVSGDCKTLILLYPHVKKHYNDSILFNINNKLLSKTKINVIVQNIDISVDFNQTLDSNISCLKDRFSNIVEVIKEQL